LAIQRVAPTPLRRVGEQKSQRNAGTLTTEPASNVHPGAERRWPVVNARSRFARRATIPQIPRAERPQIYLQRPNLWDLFLAITSRDSTEGRRRTRGEYLDGTGATFDQARADFEKAWRAFSAKRTPADFQAWRDHRDWTDRKYAMWERGERLPSQKSAP
jgi:hypothetical protein